MTYILRWCQKCQQNTYHTNARCMSHKSKIIEQEEYKFESKEDKDAYYKK